jgi:hypothetical protein
MIIVLSYYFFLSFCLLTKRKLNLAKKFGVTLTYKVLLNKRDDITT